MCTHTFDVSVTQGDFIVHLCKNETKCVSSLQAYWFSTSKVPCKYLWMDLNQYILPSVLRTYAFPVVPEVSNSSYLVLDFHSSFLQS